MQRPDSNPHDAAHTLMFQRHDGRVIDAKVRGARDGQNGRRSIDRVADVATILDLL